MSILSAFFSIPPYTFSLLPHVILLLYLTISCPLPVNCPLPFLGFPHLVSTCLFSVVQLKTVGVALSLRMTEHSSDLWLGFGSFVDKPVSPYINVHPSKINNPCR